MQALVVVSVADQLLTGGTADKRWGIEILQAAVALGGGDHGKLLCEQERTVQWRS